MSGIINSVNINPTGTISQNKTIVKLNVSATAGSSIRISVKNAAGNYYKSSTKTFTSGFAQIKKTFNTTGNFNTSFVIPRVSSADSYVFNIIAVNSEFSSSASTNSKLYTTTITQVLDSVVDFALATNTSSKYTTFPSNITSTQSFLNQSDKSVDLNWTVTAVDSSAAGCLDILRQPTMQDFYVEAGSYTTGLASTAFSNVNEVHFTDTDGHALDGLKVGMKLSEINSVNKISDNLTITEINIKPDPALALSQIVLSGNTSWTGGHVFKFRSYGTDLISYTSGAVLEENTFSVTQEDHTVIVNGFVDNNTTVRLTTIQGIRGGSDKSIVTGPSVTGTTSAPDIYVNNISNYSNKDVVLTAAQTIQDKEVLTISGTATTADIALNLKISKYPTLLKTIYFDVDGILISQTT
tara:strand:+ start:2983 stop:4212 length:1230 start_codon:yes stop_codon:yes gene_type:complete